MNKKEFYNVTPAKVFSFINMKGGVGKTTLTVNLAYEITKNSNLRVLVIDIDPQLANAIEETAPHKEVN